MAGIEIDEEAALEVAKSIADLMIQAMMFGMDIDWETGSLIRKRKERPDPFWLKKWKEKVHEADMQPRDYEGGTDER